MYMLGVRFCVSFFVRIELLMLVPFVMIERLLLIPFVMIECLHSCCDLIPSLSSVSAEGS